MGEREVLQQDTHNSLEESKKQRVVATPKTLL